MTRESIPGPEPANLVDDRDRVLVVLANLRDDAAHVATMLATELADDHVVVEIAELAARTMPAIEDYDAVVIGLSTGFRRHDRHVLDYIRAHRSALAAVPAFFYSVGSSGALDRLHDITRRANWRPLSTASFVDGSSSQQPDVRGFARLIEDAIPAEP
jgi:menaquinone-dependent protoporphyrinogen IX oxidase